MDASVDIETLGRVLDMAKDPVCGMMVDEKKTKLTSGHDGKTFYFCSAACKTAFEKDPHRYGHS